MTSTERYYKWLKNKIKQEIGEPILRVDENGYDFNHLTYNEKLNTLYWDGAWEEDYCNNYFLTRNDFIIFLREIIQEILKINVDRII